MVNINVKLRKALQGKNIGFLSSVFKGSGVDFEDHRQYQIGDETKFINWKLSAKNNDMYIKLFKQERDSDLHVFFDVNYNWKLGPSIANINSIESIYTDLLILSRKFGFNIYGFYYNNKLHNLKIGKNYFIGMHLRNKIKKTVQLSKKKYQSSLSMFLRRELNFVKSRIIVLFSDFLSMDDSDIKIIKVLSEKNEILLFKIGINKKLLIGSEYIPQKEHDISKQLDFIMI